MKATKNNKAALFLSGLLLVSAAFAPLYGATDLDTPEDAILAKGFEAYMDGKDKIALSYFEEVTRINPKNTAAVKAMEKVLERMEIKEKKEKQTNLDYAKTRLKEGNELIKTNDYVSAIDSYHAALEKAPRYKPAEKQLKKLRKEMQKTLKNKEFNVSEWTYARGVLAYMDKDWAKAYRIWSQRAQMEPRNVALQNAKERAENKFVKMMTSEREEFLRRGAREFYRQGLYQHALKSWKQILAFRDEDKEALEGMARSEDAILKIQGKNRDRRAHDLLEQGLEQYASQNYRRAQQSFKDLIQLDPEFKTAQEYLTKINRKLADVQYVPALQTENRSWRENKPSNSDDSPSLIVPEKLENLEARRNELESQLKRNPGDIAIQQQLDRMKKMQNEESERFYKDGLIAYSQGNRGLAIDKWKQVILINPDHKKASAALRKAHAEQERAVSK